MGKGIFGRLVGRLRHSDDREERAPLKIEDIRFFFEFAKPGWKMAAVSLLLTLLISIITSITPLSTKVFIDFVIYKQGYDQIEQLLSAVGLASVTPQVISFFGSIENVMLLMITGGIVFLLIQGARSYLMMRYEQEITYNVQARLFDNIMRYPLPFFKTKHSGYLMSRIVGDVQRLQYIFAGLIMTLLSQVFVLISSLAILLTLSPSITLVIACTLPFYVAINFIFSGKIRSTKHQEYELLGKVYRDIQEMLLGIEVIKTYTTNDRELGKITKRLREIINIQVLGKVIGSASGSIMRGVQYGIVLIVMWFGAHEIIKGNMTVGDFIAFMSYILLLSSSIGSLFATYLDLQPTIASLERLAEMFNVVPEYEREEKDRKGKRPEKVDGRIRFAETTFSYEVNKPVLSNVSFELRKGETLALVGASGAGKTTMINLLLKFYRPQQGTIYLDGNDIRDLDTVWLRKHIALVPQDVFVFDDTIENNIKYAKPSATREEVVGAAKKAQIHDDIMKIEGNYDAPAGEHGNKLSTGQRQRISIARAFLKDAPILVLDEPTSALDIDTERRLKESMKDLIKGRTTIIISHRMSLTDAADKVLVLKNNRVVQYGTRKELIAVEGPYQTMCAHDEAFK